MLPCTPAPGAPTRCKNLKTLVTTQEPDRWPNPDFADEPEDYARVPNFLENLITIFQETQLQAGDQTMHFTTP